MPLPIRPQFAERNPSDWPRSAACAMRFAAISPSLLALSRCPDHELSARRAVSSAPQSERKAQLHAELVRRVERFIGPELLERRHVIDRERRGFKVHG